MTAVKKQWSDFSVSEWYRLSRISSRHEPNMRLAYVKAVQQRKDINTLDLRNAVTTLVAEVCDTTARTYGMVFNPNSSTYVDTIDSLVSSYVRNFRSPEAKKAVLRLVPRNLSVSDYSNRTDTYGLDTRAAVRIERMRQEGKTRAEIDQERQRSIFIRGNVIATTETNRVVNQALLALWKDNILGTVEKAARRRPRVEYIGTSRRRISEAPHKTWMTRRDEKVCNYCDPLDGVTARLDAEFDTRYGIFDAPPIHPNCRCYMVMG